VNIRRRTARGLFWTGFQNAARRLITLVVFLVLARLLTPEDFGLVALAGALVAFVEFFIRIGFAEAIVQRKDLEPAHLDTAFWTMLGIGVLLTLLAFVLAGPIAALFNSEQLAPVIRWLSISILIISLTRVQDAVLRRAFNFKGLAIRTVIAAFGGGVVGVGFALNGMGVWSLVAQQLVEAGVGLIVLWAASNWRPGINVSSRHLGDLFGFGVNIMGAQMMQYVNQYADRIIIGYFLGPVALGYYAVGQRLILVVQQVLSNTFVTVLFSAFSRMQDDHARIRTAFFKSTQLVALAVFPVFVFLSVAGPETVEVLFGNKWANSSEIIQLLALAALLQSIIIFNDPVFKASGQPRLAFRLSAVRAGLGVLLLLVFVHYGVIAVAAAMLLRAALLIPYSFALLNHVFLFDNLSQVARLRSPVMGSVVMAGIIYLIKKNSPADLPAAAELLLMLMCGGLVYAAVLFIADRGILFEARDAARLVFARGGQNRDKH